MKIVFYVCCLLLFWGFDFIFDWLKMPFSKPFSTAAYFAFWDQHPVITALRAGNHDEFMKSAMDTYIKNDEKKSKTRD